MSMAGREDVATRCIWEEKHSRVKLQRPRAHSQHSIIKHTWPLKENSITVLYSSKTENEKSMTQGEDLPIVLQVP